MDILTRNVFLFSIAIMLQSCGSGPSDKQISQFIGKWSASYKQCNKNYYDFSRNSISFFYKGSKSGEFPVRRFIFDRSQPELLTFVIKVDEKLAVSANSTDTSDIAMQFHVSDDRMKLNAEGSPYRLMPVTPEHGNYHRFNLVRCK